MGRKERGGEDCSSVGEEPIKPRSVENKLFLSLLTSARCRVVDLGSSQIFSFWPCRGTALQWIIDAGVGIYTSSDGNLTCCRSCAVDCTTKHLSLIGVTERSAHGEARCKAHR